MRRFFVPLILVLGFQLLLVGLTGCATNRTYISNAAAEWEATPLPDASELAYQLFLIGDAGAPKAGGDPVLRLLHNQLEAANPDASGIVFLGDNIYCCGLPDSTDLSARQEAERRINAQLDIVQDFGGDVVFIPGNHDWSHSGIGGLASVRRQEAYVEAALGDRDVFLPSNGFPGPVARKVSENLVIIALDTEWMLQPDARKPFGDTGDYDLNETADIFLELDDLLRKYDDETVVIAAHHPLYSNGEHAGFFPLKTHIFPLTKLNKKAYVPLPLLGSAFPLFVRFFGGRQDIAHNRYRAMRDAFEASMAEHERLIYASGHEHNLQLFEKPTSEGPIHYVVSGSGSKVSLAAPGRGATFTQGTKGFAVLHQYKDGSSWLSYYAPEEDGATGTLLFRQQVKPPLRESIDPGIADNLPPQPSYEGRTETLAANVDYTAGSLKRFFWGSHNREVWATPVTVPYLDLGTTAGGLTPVKRGGGMQTFSLRLEGADGVEYSLRSVDKDPSVSIPENLRQTVARDIVQDQIASIHPYGAYAIPTLASAAGVIHTNPRLVYVPDDPRLGTYQSQFGGQLMMFEERPDGPMEGFASYSRAFGTPEDIISATKLYEEVDGDNDHRVDQHAFVRTRLFDMLLSDWDRHRHQWRWAEYEPENGEGKLYRPVPRDRDWALNRFNGLLPSLMKNLFDPKFQEFGPSFGYIKGLSKNGFEQDRRFTNELERADWIRQAEHLQTALTDEVIADAIGALPAEVVALHGDELIATMQIRRDQLVDVAQEYYEILAEVSDQIGSHKHERFEIVRYADSTMVTVYKTSKEGEIRRKLYARTFIHKETEEIRIYGFDGNDTFIVTGEATKASRLLLIGGPGDDTYQDDSRVRRGRGTHIFDTYRGNDYTEAGRESHLRRSDNPTIHTYDALEFQHNAVLPQIALDANPDDGVFLGGGITLVRHGFRKAPYGATHRFVGNVATQTGAFNLAYTGHVVDAFGLWDMGIEAEWRSPDNIRNFYGLGNETTDDLGTREFYQARLSEVHFFPSLRRDFIEGLTFFLGPDLYYVKIRDDNDRFTSTQRGISEAAFDDQFFFGGEAGLTLNVVDRLTNPRQGVTLSLGADANIALNEGQDNYTRLTGDFAVYASPRLEPQVTLALRVGGEHNIGDFPFYDASTLGGKSNLRGWRSTRFAGRTSFYQNAELRARLLQFSTYIALGEMGILGFLDNGRVWTDGEDSDVWHQGYGGGVWFTLFDAFALTSFVGVSPEETTFNLKLGFQY